MLMKLTPGVLNVILLDAVEGLLSHPDLSLNFGTFTVRNNLPYAVAQTTGDRTGLATGSSLYKKHVLRNWLIYVILSKTT